MHISLFFIIRFSSDRKNVCKKARSIENCVKLNACKRCIDDKEKRRNNASKQADIICALYVHF